ncbi:MAG: type I-E CRISPR-associated protein Cas5/CasD [Gammaproteobacteria bacterium]|nr:type I-E CRISPR-associated protein Cas5/CasD [Gammaproteobacteria bacterium]MCF6231357.1 type I-E CRISPR-associated protein Cas5/CasD [Gammaproteobacteria bacterium]
MSEFLMLKLYGPMASWGEIAVGEQRLSQGHPTKSAVIGLLAAALGIKREEERQQLRLANGYQMAVRVDSPGALLRDYHTVQVPPPDRGRRYYTRKDEMSVPKDTMSTILSQRDYRVDAHYTVALYGNTAPYTLVELAIALKSPCYTLYLGRKSCPLSLPLDPKVVEAEQLKSAFDKVMVDNELYNCSQLSATSADQCTAYLWEGLSRKQAGFAGNDGTYLIHERRDHVVSRKRWQFINRKEHHLMVRTGVKNELF